MSQQAFQQLLNRVTALEQGLVNQKTIIEQMDQELQALRGSGGAGAMGGVPNADATDAMDAGDQTLDFGERVVKAPGMGERYVPRKRGF